MVVLCYDILCYYVTCCGVVCYLSALVCASEEPRLHLDEARVYLGLYSGVGDE